MEEDSLLSRFGLQNLASLFKTINDSSYMRFLGRQYKEESGARYYAIGDQKPPELFAIAQGPLPNTQYETLTDEQKAGILDVVGNSTRVKRFCPFKESDSKLIQTAKFEQPSKRVRGDDQKDPSHALYSKMQTICSLLMKKTWVEYNNENPFIPRLTKTYIRQNNISDYLDRIPYPMSLTDVSQSIRNRSYQSIEDMDYDVKRIADNARIYHGAQSMFAQFGSALYDYFKELRARYFQ